MSPESEGIFDLIITLFRSCDGRWDELQKKAGISDDEIQHFLEYAGQFLGNIGNYKAVGDAKIVPRISEHAFHALASTAAEAAQLYDRVRSGIFASEDSRLMHLGYIEEGHMTTYYPDSPTITKSDITAVGDFLERKGLEIYNTRLRKSAEGDLEVLIASANTSPPETGGDIGPVTDWKLEGELKGKTLKLVYGDHSQEMARVVDALKCAQECAANDDQRKMLAEYIKSFQTGSAEAFKRSQRHWIQDKGPTVESDIGFIESYRDPHGVRAEWEGFVAMVNKERTRAFELLVASAEAMIPKLPWSREFEKDHFLSPDFTSLEVLGFAGSMIPAGINIPCVSSSPSRRFTMIVLLTLSATSMMCGRRRDSRTCHWATFFRPRHQTRRSRSSEMKISSCTSDIVMVPLRSRWAFTSC